MIEFQGDEIFGEKATQQQVFQKTGKRIIENVLEGYNATVFAYGQTGSGKTHTMFGAKNDGLAFNCVQYLFQKLQQVDNMKSFNVTISCVEIYNEKLSDKLTKSKVKLGLVENRITNLTTTSIESLKDFGTHLNMALNARVTAATNMNSVSSRSHLLVTLKISQKLPTMTKESILHIVDLAGSERVKKTNASGQRLTEAKAINTSLTALGRVVDAVLKKNSTHIPYRDSILTRIISDCLGGTSIGCMVACCSTDYTNLEETISTLAFAARAKNIRNKPILNTKVDQNSYNELASKFREFHKQATEIIKCLREKYDEGQQRIQELEKIVKNSSQESAQNNALSEKEASAAREKLKEYESKSKENAKTIGVLQDKLLDFNSKLKQSEDMLDVSKVDPKYRVVMFLEACQRGDIEYARKILPHVNVNATDSNGESALAFATKNNHYQIVECLLNHGADANVQDKDYISPLMIALVNKRMKCVEILLANNANVNLQNALGCSCIHIAASRGLSEYMNILLQYNPNVSATSHRGWTPIMFAAKCGSVEIINQLIEHGADVNAINLACCTALILATYGGKARTAQTLLKHGADFSARDKFGMTAHIWAYKKGFSQIIKLLEKNGSTLSLTDKLKTML